MSKNQKLTLLSVLVILFALGFVLVAFLSNNNRVTITVSREDLPVTVFNQDGYETTKEETSFTLEKSSDKYLYRFVNDSGDATDFYDLRNETGLSITFSYTQEAPSLSSIENRFTSDNLKLKTLKGYEDDKWVIASIVTPNIESDGLVGIYVLDSGSYVEIFSGTGPDLITLINGGVPEDIALKMLEDYSAINQI